MLPVKEGLYCLTRDHVSTRSTSARRRGGDRFESRADHLNRRRIPPLRGEGKLYCLILVEKGMLYLLSIKNNKISKAKNILIVF